MARISNVLESKGRVVHSIGPGDTVFDAVQKMVAENVGSLLVMDGAQVRGIITERDYLKNVILQGRASKTTRVEEIMTRQVAFVGPDSTIEETLAIMTEIRCRHIPVMDDGKLVGLVSGGDLIKQLIQDQEAHIQYLTEYIANKYPA